MPQSIFTIFEKRVQSLFEGDSATIMGLVLDQVKHSTLTFKLTTQVQLVDTII